MMLKVRLVRIEQKINKKSCPVGYKAKKFIDAIYGEDGYISAPGDKRNKYEYYLDNLFGSGSIKPTGIGVN